ncbi:MAG: L-ribulose-5-phosphate 4-epimerase AraD [Planctomycetes bacterium]|nr:L-ribulose-5-phosphate 4-epimerase AraD [Planctomycetota bacterium]
MASLRAEVCEANRGLARYGLACLTWGNVSGISPDREVVAIKPSGVPYDRLTPADIVLVAADGRVVEGSLRPSSDTPTHWILYQAFPSIGGITHTHSPYATMFAQARREIHCLGTTHADHFHGSIPVTRQLTPAEVEAGYEEATGHAIVERLRGLNPAALPAVLVAGHAPFCWGCSASESLKNAIALETVALMAYGTAMLAEPAKPTTLEPYILTKHHERKHGPSAYYGQS